CAFGIPLVPAHQRSNPSDPRVERAETQVARGEVELLVIRGIVGDVHLTVDPYHTAVGVDHGHAVVVQPGCTPLEHRREDDHPRALGRPPQGLGGRPRHGRSEVEQRGVLVLREVERAEQLRQTDQPRAGRGRFLDLDDALLQVAVRVGRHRQLDEPDPVFRLVVRAGRGGGALWPAAARFWSTRDYLLPFYSLRAEKLAGAPAWFLPAFVVWTLPFLWIGVAMTLRRAVDAGRSPWLALTFFVPLFNYLVML